MIESLCASKCFIFLFFSFLFSSKVSPKWMEHCFLSFKDAIGSILSKDADIWTSAEPKFLLSFLTLLILHICWRVKSKKKRTKAILPIHTPTKSCICPFRGLNQGSGKSLLDSAVVIFKHKASLPSKLLSKLPEHDLGRFNKYMSLVKGDMPCFSQWVSPTELEISTGFFAVHKSINWS